MANRYRGEIEADLGGRKRILVLTLGALAELESAFAAQDLAALAERFGTGRLSARDLVRVIGAGLRGAGETVTDADVAAMPVGGGASGYVRIAANLIKATFSDEDASWGGEVKPFPWREVIGFGLEVLRLPPEQFWRMTPRELAFAIAAVRGPVREPLDRLTLTDLMQRFPDRPIKG